MGSKANTRVILITGGCGYIGSQLIRDLAGDPRFADVIIRILDNMQRGGYPALMNLPTEGRYQFIEGDILDPVTVRWALRGVDAVVHLAAVVRTPFSYDHPAWMEQVNHWGTAQLVEQCLDAQVTRFFFASSASVYGPGGVFEETSACRPVGPYAQSKWRAERVVMAARERGLRPTILRLATAFGYAPTMRFDAVANRFAYLAGIGRPLTVYGTGEQIRPLIHVRDVSRAIRFCLAHSEDTEDHIFNVVGENASVLDIVEAVRSVKPEVRIHYTEQDVLTHLSFAIDGRKFEEMGWEPRYTVETGMAEVLALFKGLAVLSAEFSEITTDSIP
ncbi:MAG TPA: SDR family NAD-dependent epimerase/dehydratase [Chloroflexi bacterium]|nr:SDR family NAD-dependent epimerase/dehydratase [Chloroflexota bacterium]